MSRARQRHHLPKQGGPGASEPPPELPRQRRGTVPQGRGRYPDYDVLAEADHWDAHTREVVLARLEPPPLRFFDAAEARALSAFCDDVLAQEAEPRVPVLAMVDEKLYEKKLDGFRYAEMPPDPETWRQVAKLLDAAAGAAGAGEGYAAAPREERHRIVERFAGGELEQPGIDTERAWSVVMRGVLSAFYSHPWSWSEIGFGGPAYPRGFARLGAGQREHWERPPEFEVDPVEDVPARGLE